MNPLTSSSTNPDPRSLKNAPSRDKEDITRKELEKTKDLQKHLTTLQAEEKSLHSIMVELRSQNRKLNLEKYRLMELRKKKIEEERVKQGEKSQNNSTEQPTSSYTGQLFMF